MHVTVKLGPSSMTQIKIKCTSFEELFLIHKVTDLAKKFQVYIQDH